MPLSRKRTDFKIARAALPGVEAMEARSDHVFARHSHDRHGVGLMLAGGQTSASGRGRVEALLGDVITVNPGEVHDGAPVGGAPRAWRMLYLPAPLTDAAAADLGDGATGDYEFLHPVARDVRIAACFRRLYAAVTSGDGSDAAALLREELLLALLNGLKARAPAQRIAGVSAGVARARALIDDAPAAPLALDDLARTSGLSRFQLVRQFARATGLTPHAYLIQRRIEAVRALLARGTALADAAAAGGFADQSHMTRIFIRTYGITPGAYAAALA